MGSLLEVVVLEPTAGLRNEDCPDLCPITYAPDLYRIHPPINLKKKSASKYTLWVDAFIDPSWFGCI